MSSETTLSPDKEKKRPSVSSKCLLNIKTIVTQQVSSNRNNKNLCLRSPTSILPPLPLVNSLVPLKESSNHFNGAKTAEEKKRKKSQSLPNRNILIECLQKSSNKEFITNK